MLVIVGVTAAARASLGPQVTGLCRERNLVTRLFARQWRNPTSRATASLLKSTTGSVRRRSPAGTPMVSAMSWLCHQLPEKNSSRLAISKKLLQFQLLQLKIVYGCMRVPRELGLSFYGRNRIFPFATSRYHNCLQSWRDWVRLRNGKNEPSQGRRVGGRRQRRSSACLHSSRRSIAGAFGWVLSVRLWRACVRAVG
jgi:hypothetical protein